MTTTAPTHERTDTATTVRCTIFQHKLKLVDPADAVRAPYKLHVPISNAAGADHDKDRRRYLYRVERSGDVIVHTDRFVDWRPHTGDVIASHESRSLEFVVGSGMQFVFRSLVCPRTNRNRSTFLRDESRFREEAKVIESAGGPKADSIRAIWLEQSRDGSSIGWTFMHETPAGVVKGRLGERGRYTSAKPVDEEWINGSFTELGGGRVFDCMEVESFDVPMEKDGKVFSIKATFLAGKLEVIDPVKFMRMLTCGVGKYRHAGLGLVSVR